MTIERDMKKIFETRDCAERAEGRTSYKDALAWSKSDVLILDDALRRSKRRADALWDKTRSF